MGKTYKAGDILKVTMGFTDNSGSKGRPALVISKMSVNNPNYLVLQVTSTKRSEDIQFELDNSMITNGKLPALSWVNFTVVSTIHHKLIEKKYGELNKSDLRKVINKFKSILF